MKKYELILTDTVNIGEKTLYRIQALKRFGKVKAGDLGGYIQSEKNLSQEGNAWVSGRAKVMKDARVEGNALVSGSSIVGGRALIMDDVIVSDSSMVCGDAVLLGHTHLTGRCCVCGNARLVDAYIGNDAFVSKTTDVFVFQKVTFYKKKNEVVVQWAERHLGIAEYIKEVESIYGVSSMATMHKEAAKMAQFLFSATTAVAV